MKRIISLTLALLMLAAMLCTATSCEFGMESMTGFTQLRDYVMEKDGATDSMSGIRATITAAYDEKEDKDVVRIAAIGDANKFYIYLGIMFTGSTEKAYLEYMVQDKQTMQFVGGASGEILLTHYTGNDLVTFTETNREMLASENTHREYATSLLNALLIELDVYMNKNLDLSVRDLGFIVLSEKYMADSKEVEAEEDLGGAFSSARLQKAGLMLLQGMGMVFLVLIILWIVLLIFKAVFAKDSAKAEKEAKRAAKETAKAEKATPAPAATPEMKSATVAAPAAPVADDGQLIAVITAAVAAAIEADPALSSQFASGFRVVSFKKTDKSRNR